MFQERRICARCVLPESKPVIFLNEQGVCNICLDFEKRKRYQNVPKLLESELIKVINKNRKKSGYDCLVMCSGGKDSTAALYFIRKRYKLNPLAFTFDNGFENKQAIDNVARAVDMLGVDWVYFKSDFMKEMFSEVIKMKYRFSICPLCSLWYMQLTYQTSTRYDLPLIISGWTQGQLTSPIVTERLHDGLQSERSNCRLGPEKEFILLCSEISSFIDMMRKKYSKYASFPKDMNEIRKRYKISKKANILSPHWFLPHETEYYTDLIRKELGWRLIDSSYPLESTNCQLNLLGSYLSMQKYGFTHFHVEMSKLIRLGKMGREEALRKLELNISNEPESSIIGSVLERLGCSKNDL